jgi:hypothetical protein
VTHFPLICSKFKQVCSTTCKSVSNFSLACTLKNIGLFNSEENDNISTSKNTSILEGYVSLKYVMLRDGFNTEEPLPCHFRNNSRHTISSSFHFQKISKLTEMTSRYSVSQYNTIHENNYFLNLTG